MTEKSKERWRDRNMPIVREGDLQFDFSSAQNVRKFDDPQNHGLSHCMKSVDYIVELNDKTLFIEVKDPQHPNAKQKPKVSFVQEFLSGKLDEILKYKYRDSFLYEWASEAIKKPVYYVVLIAVDALSQADLLRRTDSLKRIIPFDGPSSGIWKRKIVAGCVVLNINEWNKQFHQFPVSRISKNKP
ncbi:MAG: hypothetical protein AB1656_27555 [Candidatus Omnitrophota bacterium]